MGIGDWPQSPIPNPHYLNYIYIYDKIYVYYILIEKEGTYNNFNF